MAYEADRDASKEPSIAEMTDKAIQILSKNEKGFLLLIEGNSYAYCLQCCKLFYSIVSTSIEPVQYETIQWTPMLVFVRWSFGEETGVPWRNVPFQPGEMANSLDVSCTRVLNINYYLSTIH